MGTSFRFFGIFFFVAATHHQRETTSSCLFLFSFLGAFFLDSFFFQIVFSSPLSRPRDVWRFLSPRDLSSFIVLSFIWFLFFGSPLRRPRDLSSLLFVFNILFSSSFLLPNALHIFPLIAARDYIECTS